MTDVAQVALVVDGEEQDRAKVEAKVGADYVAMLEAMGRLAFSYGQQGYVILTLDDQGVRCSAFADGVENMQAMQKLAAFVSRCLDNAFDRRAGHA